MQIYIYCEHILECWRKEAIEIFQKYLKYFKYFWSQAKSCDLEILSHRLIKYPSTFELKVDIV